MGTHAFEFAKPVVLKAAGVLAVLCLAGCISASSENSAPARADQQAGVAAENGETPRDTRFVAQGALRNETYPTFAGTPSGATEQLSAAEREELEAEMEEVRAAFGAGALSADDYRRRVSEIQAIARSHADEAKEAIEE